MKTVYVIPALLCATVLASSVFAAERTYPKPAQPAAQSTHAQTADRCNALERQFDQVVGAHDKASRLANAKMARSEGQAMCVTGKYAEGITKLETALRDIGVTPRS